MQFVIFRFLLIPQAFFFQGETMELLRELPWSLTSGNRSNADKVEKQKSFPSELVRLRTLTKETLLKKFYENCLYFVTVDVLSFFR